MKKALRIIVPLILAIAVVVCAIWYFMVYDQALTRELLLRGARYFESNGNHNISAWVYDLAYNQSHQDDEIAIELANQYLSVGNHTKAEYTLTKAIEKNPTANLYIALSELFVKQDKLLDAVNMLNGIEDIAISNILASMRPTAPVPSHEPGFYNEYISVSFQSSTGKLYVSTDGEYPSIHEDPYTEAITLPISITSIYAVSVADNGLVSPLTICEYTIAGVVEQVTFMDAATEAALRALIGADEDDVIFTDQLWDITEFTVPAEARSYEDLALLPNLTKLTVEPGSTGDLSVLSSLPALKELSITNIRINDKIVELIGAYSEMEKLTLSGCGLSSISKLEALTKLEYLDLSNNTLRNISLIGTMPGMKELYLGHNSITSIDHIASLTNIEKLDISYNAVSDLSGLKQMKNLTDLNAGHNQISRINGLNFQKMQALDLSYNNIQSIGSIVDMTEILSLNLSNNALTELGGIEKLMKLRSLNMSYNQVKELPSFNSKCDLVTIDASHNLLDDVDSLAGLPRLNTVNVDYNEEIESLEPLDKCHVLIKVNAYGTKVKDVTFLTAKSIIVNFNPTLDQ